MARVIVYPSLATFEETQSNGNLGRAILATAASGTLTGMIGGLVNLILANSSLADIVILMLITPLRFLGSFLVAQAFLFAALRTLGGRGEFATQAYLSALAFAPLSAVSSLLAILPTVGRYLALATLLYTTVLTAFALRAAHGQSMPSLVLVLLSLIGGLIGWGVSSSLPQ
jgi:hypothetical protein